MFWGSLWRLRGRRGLLSILVVLSLQANARSHNGRENSAAAVENGIARGVVFADQNGNGIRDPGEPGLPRIGVSNGRSIVSTDDQGRYEIGVGDDTIIFVIKPRGWDPPRDSNQLARFYYIHKPHGSPKLKYPGVEPTGPLPDSIDFALTPHAEPEQFRILLMGDPQPGSIKQVEYFGHDVIEQILGEHGHGAAFGVTLGDIVGNDLNLFRPMNQTIALLDLPWYNVIGNHDVNRDVSEDHLADETFERVYGPPYYSFDHGPVHFLVLDDVVWTGHGPDRKPQFHGGLGDRQMEFIRNDLARIPEDQLVVLMMHIPLIDVEDRHELYELIQQRPFAVSIAAHTHDMQHVLIGKEDGWHGEHKHHHIINVTACGSWWRGLKDERGLPHTTMADGAPNGYSIMSFDGQQYSLQFRAAGRPAEYQMEISLPEVVSPEETAKSQLVVNVFGGSERSSCEYRIVGQTDWQPVQHSPGIAPRYREMVRRERALKNGPKPALPAPRHTEHLWSAELSADLRPGVYHLQVRSTDMFGATHRGQRTFRVE